MAHDPRMKGFRRYTPSAEVLAQLHSEPLEGESVALRAAHGRVLTDDVVALTSHPSFDRSAMDGYALDAHSVAGASDYAPLTFKIIGESLPGHGFGDVVGEGEAVRIMTGAPIPTGANCVVPVEFCEESSGNVTLSQGVVPGKHVSAEGEDIRAGATVLASGRQLRPQDVGLLASLGRSEVAVVRQPRVEILTTGNELLSNAESAHHIHDADGPMLHGLVLRDGGVPVTGDPIADSPEAIGSALDGLTGDVAIITGGSSVGREDYVPSLVAERGDLLVHGVAVRPAAPTGIARLPRVPGGQMAVGQDAAGNGGARWVFLLPGNPVSCLCGYDLFAGPIVRQLAGRSAAWPYRRLQLPMRRKIASQTGRLDYARVQIVDGGVEPLMVSGASILSSATKADGVVLIPDDLEGYDAGDLVDVWLYDEIGLAGDSKQQ